MVFNNEESNTHTALMSERAGEYVGAARQFIAEALKVESAEAAPLWNQAAINYRLAGEECWDLSQEFFDLAFRAAKNQELLLGRVSRDRAMLFLDQAVLCQERFQLEESEEYFDKAERLLRSAMAYQIFDSLELAVTAGFLGRLELLRDQKSHARKQLEISHELLHQKHDVYELNNLIWLLKSESMFGRWRRLPRAIHLARKTGYLRRAAEALLIAISPSLYETLRRR